MRRWWFLIFEWIIVIFCSTLSEFENFLLCERILINVTNVKTKRQANFKDFKRFGAFKGLVEQKNVVFNSFVGKLAPIYTQTRQINYYYATIRQVKKDTLLTSCP
jgi:hypothetical protein